MAMTLQVELVPISKSLSFVHMSKTLCYFALSGLAAFILLSCGMGSDQNTLSTKGTQYELVKVDSIRIDKLEAIQITDYDAENRRLLAYATSTKLCLEMDMEGNILNEADLTGEGPGHFGMGLTELGYFGDGKVIHGPAVYFTYNDDWSYLNRIVYSSSGGYSIPLRYISGAPVTLERDGEPALIRVINHNMEGHVKLEPGYFDTAQQIKILTSGAEEEKTLLNYPENSIYRTSDLYFDLHRPKISFNEVKRVLVVALPLEQRLYLYDAANEFALTGTFDLDLSGFNIEPRGLPYDDQHKNAMKGFGRSNELNYVYSMTNSQILEIDSQGEVTIVVHKTGFSNNAITSFSEANSMARSESKTFTSFFIGGQKVFETNERFPRLVRLSERQFIVPNINEEIERDYNQYDIYELREKIEMDR